MLFKCFLVINYHLSDAIAAFIYSAFKREILVMDISFGQTASQAPVKVQEPNSSLSIWATIFNTLDFLSGSPCGNKARWETLADTNNMAEEFLQAATHAPHPIHEAAANDLSAFSFSTGIAFPSTALPVLTEHRLTASFRREVIFL